MATSLSAAAIAPRQQQRRTTTKGTDMHIKPLSSLTRAEISDLAQAACDSGEDLGAANPFERDTWQFTAFHMAYLARLDQIEPALA